MRLVCCETDTGGEQGEGLGGDDRHDAELHTALVDAIYIHIHIYTYTHTHRGWAGMTGMTLSYTPPWSMLYIYIYIYTHTHTHIGAGRG